jgi:putative DNA methylase
MPESWKDDLRLIEAGFPCHQVGAETQRERGASSALPPLYFLHVWWARRPLTPSRAAILASLLPADTDPNWFLQQLGIEKRVVKINGVQWTLTGKILDKIQKDETGQEVLLVDQTVLGWLKKENVRREQNLGTIKKLKSDSNLANDPILLRWEEESKSIPEPWPETDDKINTTMIPANPAHINDRIQFAKLNSIKKILGKPIKWDPEDLYGYNRAFSKQPQPFGKAKVILDPTAGGGSIPFEALRLGHQVIANELNPVASVILHATLEYPAKYGIELADQIELWGSMLHDHVAQKMKGVTPFSPLPLPEQKDLADHCKKCPEIIPQFDVPEYDQTGILYCRQVTCPNCNSDAPLLNTCWLSKEDGKQWGVKIIPDGRTQHGAVRFETYPLNKGKGPGGEDPNFATVNRAVGLCIHCRQAIDANEIKAQARGESAHGTWKDRLYCVVAVRFQPKLDKDGKPQRFKSGEKKGEIKTEKIRFFRPPNRQDLEALNEAEKRLKENWDRWDAQGLIPTEKFPQGNDMRPVNYGMPRWCDMFTSRQLLGHLTLVEELNRLKPRILLELGYDKGRAVMTYLQFAIDKGLDYNTALSTWESTRNIVKHLFARHDFSLKWTFGEMIFSGPHSGFAWCLSQIYDAYKGMAELMPGPLSKPPIEITCGTAAYMPSLKDNSVDLICIDPPYYNNVQYAELSDFFYVWQKRTLQDLYPDYFKRRLTDKQNEAVANPDRDGGSKSANLTYEKMMSDIFRECHRVINPLGIMTLMFTHKSQDAWEALTRSLISSKWTITATVPVEAESTHSMHLMEKAGAVSSVFIACRKRTTESSEPALWTGLGGSGVQNRIQQAVIQGLKEFEALKLNAVDEMVASYGRALRVLSEQWPVIDGDEEVGPVRAMNEASRVVSENQIQRITNGRLKVKDLSPEAAMAVTLFGIYRFAEFPYDDALNISKSLNIALESKSGGYDSNGRFIGYNTQSGTSERAKKASAEDTGFHAPLVRKGSRLRLARPEERHQKRNEFPQSEWDLLCGFIMAYRKGDIPVARAYLDHHGEGKTELVRHLLEVWAAEIPDETLKKEAQTILFSLK